MHEARIPIKQPSSNLAAGPVPEIDLKVIYCLNQAISTFSPEPPVEIQLLRIHFDGSLELRVTSTLNIFKRTAVLKFLLSFSRYTVSQSYPPVLYQYCKLRTGTAIPEVS